MRIGIITFHHAHNSGAMLQVLALQTYLQKLGHEVTVVNYRIARIDKSYASSSARRKYNFEHFMEQNLHLGPKFSSLSSLQKAHHPYDAIIAGSDQIWNLECSSYDLTYFLDFVTACKRKFSYAASIGNYKFTEKEEKLIADHIKNLNGISVREESAKETLSNMGIGNVAVLPDPVFLLREEEWKSVMKKRLYEGKYVLVYLIQEDVNVLKCAEEYARKNGCKLINNKKSLEFILHNSPDEFLSWVYYSECVFTNSFHGTTFSLIFGKDLGADIELKNGGINSRVYELLKKSDAEECIINKGVSVPFKPKAEEYIEEMRNLAFEFLEKI